MYVPTYKNVFCIVFFFKQNENKDPVLARFLCTDSQSLLEKMNVLKTSSQKLLLRYYCSFFTHEVIAPCA